MQVYILATAAAISLAACSSGGSEQNSGDMNASDPNAENMMMTDDNAALANGAGGMDMNTATDAQTETQMSKDLNTNDKDTNLSNGM